MEHHKRHSEKIVPAEAFKGTETKIDNCFLAGHGTLLFFEDQDVVKGLQNAFHLMPTISPFGRNRHQPCISWRFGPCSKTSASVSICNIIIRSSMMRWLKEWSIPFMEADCRCLWQSSPQPGEKQYQPIEESESLQIIDSRNFGR